MKLVCFIQTYGLDTDIYSLNNLVYINVYVYVCVFKEFEIYYGR